MPFVLVSVPTITVSLVGPASPQLVQVAVSGLTAGQVVAVTGSAAGSTWGVRGGDVVATGDQLILSDILAPVNVPVTYTVTVDGTPFLSDPVTVPYVQGRNVLQSIDGRTVIPFAWHDTGDEREIFLRSQAYDVAGRSDGGPVRWDVAAGEGGSMRARMSSSATQTLRTHLFTQGPLLVLRTDGGMRDFPTAQYLRLTRVSRVLFDFVDGNPERLWDLAFTVHGDPDPTAQVRGSTADDFDRVYASSTWGELETTTRTNLVTNPSVETNLTEWGSASGATVTRDSAWAAVGGWSVKLTPSSASNDSYVGVGGATGAMRLGMQAGKTYTIAARSRIASALTGTLHARSRRVVVFRSLAATPGVYLDILGSAPDVNGRSVLTFTLPADTVQAFVRLYNGASNVADNSVWWDALILEEGTPSGDYFDGDTVDTVTTTYAWTGAANASTSTATTQTPVAGSFDAEWADGTGDEFDRVDWSTR